MEHDPGDEAEYRHVCTGIDWTLQEWESTIQSFLYSLVLYFI